MINRAAVLLKYTDFAIEWLNKQDEEFELTQEEVNDDRTVYLISEADAEDLDKWIDQNYLVLFSYEMEGWFEDPDEWPRNLNKELFNKWFEVECNSLVLDTVDEAILKEEL